MLRYSALVIVSFPQGFPPVANLSFKTHIYLASCMMPDFWITTQNMCQKNNLKSAEIGPPKLVVARQKMPPRQK